MKRSLQLYLLAIVVCATGVDIAWTQAGHFDVDARAYGMIAVLAAICAAGGLFYDRIRKNDRLSAMLMGTSFLLGMSSSFGVLNYLLLTVAGPRIDLSLAAIDRAMGVNWPAMMTFMSHYPIMNAILQLAYISVLSQIALVLVAIGLWGKPERVYTLSLAVACGALISIAVWTLAPSFGAFSVYSLPANVSSHLALALDEHYAKSLIALLAQGPGHISPHDLKGLIGFPSYHAVLALIVMWYARELPFVRWFVLALDAIVLIATPIQGGHHVIDVIAGVGVAALSILAANALERLAARSQNALILDPQPATP